MSDWKPFFAIGMGVVILVADIAWLIIGNSYTYTPWLILGVVILIADVIWLALDVALIRGAKPTTASTPATT